MKRKRGKLSADWWKLGTCSFDFSADGIKLKNIQVRSDGNTRDGGPNSWSRRWNQVEKKALVLFKDAISLMNLSKEMKRHISSISMCSNATEWRPSSRGMRSELLSRVAVFFFECILQRFITYLSVGHSCSSLVLSHIHWSANRLSNFQRSALRDE